MPFQVKDTKPSFSDLPVQERGQRLHHVQAHQKYLEKY